MRFREHRGGLAESMDTLVTFHPPNERDKMIAYIRGLLWPFDHLVIAKDVKLRQYTPDGDKRIGWDQLYIVTLEGYGVVGFTDGPCDPPPSRST